MARKLKTKDLKNLDMNKQVYKLRRNVMELIYEAKAVVPTLPRISVRITEKDYTINGVGRMNDCIIWIPANSAGRTKDQLRRTVFHEILHAAYGVEHVDGCKLMGPVYNNISKQDAEKLFAKYAK